MRLGFASAEQPAHIRMTTRRHFPTPPLPSSPSLKEALPPLIRESEAPLTSCAPYQARSPLRALALHFPSCRRADPCALVNPFQTAG
jgi:hypothetical protein